jgi:hypothetical protein
MRRPWRVLPACALVAVVSRARADADPAQAQFDQGLADMEAGLFDAGCPKLAESYRLDPQPGVLFTLAECEAKRGKLATAVVHYRSFLDLLGRMGSISRAKQQQRERLAQAQLQSLRPRLPELTVLVPPAAPADATVERDGVALDRASIGVGLPVDPGEHKVRLRLADGRDRTYVVTLAEGERRRLKLELPPEHVTAEPPTASTSSSSWPWVLIAAGGAGVVVGSVTGVLAVGNASTAHSHCTDRVCDPEGKDAAERANGLGWISTGALGAGVLLAGFGGWLLLSKPTQVPGKVSYVAPRGLGLEFGATF